MTTTQKIIKYFAIAFAVLLIVSIISIAIKGIAFVVNVVDGKDSVSDAELIDYKIKDAQKLNIDIEAADIKVVLGDKFTLKSNHEYIEVKESAGTLNVTEKNNSWEFFNETYEVVLTIPESAVLQSTSIDAGAGKVVLEGFTTKELDLGLGAGEVKLNKVKVTQECDFEGGAGAVYVTDCTFTNLDMEIGVGECNLTAFVLGKSNIECGVGAAYLTFYEDKDNDYAVSVSKGLGSVTVDGKSVSDEEIVGNGNNKLNIDCGVGEVDIKFKNK